jgi:hypothetical protein
MDDWLKIGMWLIVCSMWAVAGWHSGRIHEMKIQHRKQLEDMESHFKNVRSVFNIEEDKHSTH